MGNILNLPAAVCTLVAEKGFAYCIAYYSIYVCLSIFRYFRRKRLDSYDVFADGQPQKLGLLAPDIEWELDCPRSKSSLEKAVDDAFCFGSNSSSDFLTVHISRQPNRKVRCSLLLRLASGKKYSLPEEHLTQSESSEPCTFGSERLKLQCLQPMRKWRIFFNGTLKEESVTGGTTSSEYKHVKFIFLWTASSEVYDFFDDLPASCLSHLLVSSLSKAWWPTTCMAKVRDVLDNYEQPGMILGTYTIEGEQEKELYMWGLRGRYMGRTRDISKGDFMQIYGQFQTGASVHLEFLDIPGVIPKLTHGFVMHSNGFIGALKTCEEGNPSCANERNFKLCCGDRPYTLVVKKLSVESVEFHKEYPGNACISSAEMSLNQISGKGLIFEGNIQRIVHTTLQHTKPHSAAVGDISEIPLTLSFTNPECQNPSWTGGKGSSLGKLSALARDLHNKEKSPELLFDVPRGIVVTTQAYKLFVHGQLETHINKFQKKIWHDTKVDVNQLCQKLMLEITEAEFPTKLANAIVQHLQIIFGDTALDIKYAIRSSATGEDTEQMSAAGQMETFLGIRGVEQLINAVKKCWASQFSFQAVEYKRRYGQLLNTPMAVVIQQMVPCDIAGVLFTCDPVTGDPSCISITANWGLGETVVSASAEPDTITLKRDLRNTLKFHSCQIGNKEKKIVMDDESGTKEVEVKHLSSELCVSEETSLKLGKIALKVEEYFGAPRDVEWGIVGDKVFLLQARPVTSLDVDSDFETKHMFDNYLRMEKEYMTKANIGEVMPGATSPLGSDILIKTFQLIYPRQGVFRWDGWTTPDVPYFQNLTCFILNHGLINCIDGIFRLGTGDPVFQKALMVSIFGRVIDDKEIGEIAQERHGLTKPGILRSLLIKIKALDNMFRSSHYIKTRAKKLMKLDFPLMAGLSSAEILHQIGCHFHYIINAMDVHIEASIASSNWNMILLTALAKAEDDLDTDVYSDFAYLLSTCSDVESADVPAALQNLGKTVSQCIDPKTFKQMSCEEAFRYLKSSAASEHFNRFLERHGHRCLKESDVMSHPWDTESGMLMLTKMLQSYVSPDIKEVKKKDEGSFRTILSHMHVHLDLKSKFSLWIILPFCRRGVKGREFTKSLTVKMINKLRKAVQKLSEQMVKEGYLPSKDLIYYLCCEEINQLIKTRSPKLVSRAIKRQRVHPELDKLIFPEICVGVPRPINAEEEEVGDGIMSMQGIPVSQGVVKAPACVITDFEQVSSIQKGDVLITYSTDIGWSPYFPLLSGVVTELGGLISHGAVVAREYGLPCVVGLHGATKVFRSGDLVILDGNKGILKKIES